MHAYGEMKTSDRGNANEIEGILTVFYVPVFKTGLFFMIKVMMVYKK